MTLLRNFLFSLLGTTFPGLNSNRTVSAAEWKKRGRRGRSIDKESRGPGTISQQIHSVKAINSSGETGRAPQLDRFITFESDFASLYHLLLENSVACNGLGSKRWKRATLESRDALYSAQLTRVKPRNSLCFFIKAIFALSATFLGRKSLIEISSESIAAALRRQRKRKKGKRRPIRFLLFFQVKMNPRTFLYLL